ncbi:hypothetical protein GFL89_25215 [Rhizobium leguminosarum bv. viciae]|nr:hypothetical protein [Rhizobium leguminosarum bv. viciae]
MRKTWRRRSANGTAWSAIISPAARRNFIRNRAIPGKVRSGFPSGIASKQKARAVPRFQEGTALRFISSRW